MGTKGASFAMILGSFFTISYMIFNYKNSPERARKFINVFSDGFGKFFNQTKDITKAGIAPLFAMRLVSVKIWVIYQILGATGGADAMALYAICMACLSVATMCMAGCNGSMMPVIGMLYCEKDFVGMRMLMKYILKFLIKLVGTFTIFIFIFPQAILMIYGVETSLFEAGKAALRLFSISLIGIEAR